MTQLLDLSPLAPPLEALLNEGLSIAGHMNGSESPVELSALYFRLAGIVKALEGAGGTSRQHVDFAGLCEFVHGLAVGLTILGRYIIAPEEGHDA